VRIRDTDIDEPVDAAINECLYMLKEMHHLVVLEKNELNI